MSQHHSSSAVNYLHIWIGCAVEEIEEGGRQVKPQAPVLSPVNTFQQCNTPGLQQQNAEKTQKSDRIQELPIPKIVN
jgi:hypothetical protein